ncbi:MAG TPA: helix-turn-helix domain-containing protein, partial [Chitinophagaceae bacterium]|nr:helix-turn-helix domain-containing protein [Chitinophagaceae bacterium]
EAEGGDYTLLHQRTKAAADYFGKAMDALVDRVEKHAKEWEGKAKVKKYLKDLEDLKTVLWRKKLQIQQAVHITTGLTEGLDAMALLQIVEEQRKATGQTENNEADKEVKKEGQKLPKGQTRLLTLQLYREGKSLADIAVQRGLSHVTIEGHLASCVETGDIDVHELVSEEKFNMIMKAIEQTDGTALTPIKEKLSNDISYGEIKAVMGYRYFTQLQTRNEVS